MFAWIKYQHYENELMDELLSSALEWGDYELAIDILEKSSRSSVPKDRVNQTLFTKLHLLAVIYDRQGIMGMAEKIYNRALCCMMDETVIDPVEVALFLKNYSVCLRRMNMKDLARGLETIADTFQYSSFTNFLELARNAQRSMIPANVEMAAQVA
jgi:hypothetical protein